MNGTVYACPRIPTYAWSKRRLQIEVGRKHELVKSKTSWISLTQIPFLLFLNTHLFLISLCIYPPTGCQTLTMWPHYRHGYSLPFLPSMPQLLCYFWLHLPPNLLLGRARLSKVDLFPVLTHPCGCTINVDISPEQDFFKKYFRWMPGQAAWNVMVTFQRDLPGVRVSKNSHCVVWMWRG